MLSSVLATRRRAWISIRTSRPCGASNRAAANPDRVRELSARYDDWAARSGVKP